MYWPTSVNRFSEHWDVCSMVIRSVALSNANELALMGWYQGVVGQNGPRRSARAMTSLAWQARSRATGQLPEPRPASRMATLELASIIIKSF